MKTIITLLHYYLLQLSVRKIFWKSNLIKQVEKSMFKFGENQNGMYERMQEQLKARMQKMSQKTFILNFDKTASIYKEDVKLNAPKPQVRWSKC